MFRFTIRDLLWLTLVVALALAWFVHQRQLRAEVKTLEDRMGIVEQRLADQFDIEVSWEDGDLLFLKYPLDHWPPAWAR